MARSYFTLAQAQALLPSIRAYMSQALQLHGHLRTEIAELTRGGQDIRWALLRREAELDDDASPEAHTMLERARMIYGALRESIATIEGLGVEVKDVVDGLIDFRSWRDGHEEVLLCWRLGEPHIEWFHGEHDGFAGRRSIHGHDFLAERSTPAVEAEPPACGG